MLEPPPAPDSLSLLAILLLASLLAWFCARDIWFLRNRVSPLWIDVIGYVVTLGGLAALIYLRESRIYVWNSIYLEALIVWYSVSMAVVAGLTEKRKGMLVYLGARKLRFVHANAVSIKTIGWRSVVVVVLASIIVAAVAGRSFRTYYLGLPEGTAIVALGGVLVIPSKYWLDAMTYETGTSFKEFRKSVGGRIAVGRQGELKPEFWAWVSKSKQSEQTRCGINMVSTLDDTVKTILAYDDRHYVWFVEVPDSEIESSIVSLCRWRERRADRAISSSNTAVVRDARPTP